MIAKTYPTNIQYGSASPKSKPRVQRSKYVGRAIGMVLSANPKCFPCRGTGWEPDFQERCMRRCLCTDPNEIVTGD